MDSFTLNKIEFGEIRRILSEYCACSLGKELCRRISPSRTPDVVHKWLQQVTQMRQAVAEHGLPPFGGVTDVTAALERARPGGGAGGEEYATIACTLEGSANVKKWLDALGENFDKLHELSAGLLDFAGEIAAIHSILEPDGTVRDGASVRLGEIRRKIADTSKQIHDQIYSYLRDAEVAKILQNVAVTLHGDRYVLPVRAEHRGRLPGVVHRESATGATVFVEPSICVELNNHLSDLQQDQRDEIQRLLNQLAIRVGGRAPDIAATLRMLAQVDLVSAKAQYSYQFEMTCPEVTERGPLVFHQVRHPLLIDQARQQELAGVPADRRHAVVPIDVRLGQDFDLLVITGSNTGGKTVALKTVAALALMAQSGMHIPAGRGSTMPAFHDVFLDVGDEQSLQQSLSTFGAHIKRVKYILHKAGAQSLVLLDELGSGTDPDEGGAIGQAILDELLHLRCLGMVTTHLSVLKAYAFSHERVDNASVTFDTTTLSPTYHLIIGTPGESHAITVAQKLGMPKRIVGASRHHLGEQGKQFRRAIQSTTAVRQSAEAARAEAVAAALEARSQQEVYQAKLADLNRLQEEFETWLARLSELKAGDEVFVPSMGKTGHLVRLELHRQIALVDSDPLQVEVPLSELMPDLGQSAVREQIAALRKQILDQARATEEARSQAARIQEEYHRSLVQQKERARQFDTWLGAIARLKVGDEVPIARRPGHAQVTKVDLPGLRVTVQIDGADTELPLQDIFPQTGPFAHLPQHRPPPPQPQRRPQMAAGQQGVGSRGRGVGGHAEPAIADQRGHERRDHGTQSRGDHRPPPKREPEPDRPMYRRDPDSQAAVASKAAILALKPGEQVFVVPFGKRATLIRINAEKEQATVQSGIFEMQLPLSDLEIVRQPAHVEQGKPHHGEKPHHSPHPQQEHGKQPPASKPAEHGQEKKQEQPAAPAPEAPAEPQEEKPPLPPSLGQFTSEP